VFGFQKRSFRECPVEPGGSQVSLGIGHASWIPAHAGPGIDALAFRQATTARWQRCSDREFRQDRFQRHTRHVETNAGGTPMTSAIARKVVQAFKQPATFTTTFEPVKLEMVRKM
jgi:hypothetical protein